MSADPREAEILPHLYGYTICDCCNGARPRLDALRSYLAALTDAQLSALGLTRRREGQPAEGWPHGVCPDCGQKVGRHACYRGVVEPPLASPREAPEGDKDDGSAAGDTAGSTGVSAVPSGSALGSLPLTPEAPGAGEKCGDCGGSGRPWDSAGNQLNRACLSCRGTGTARPDARPAETGVRYCNCTCARHDLRSELDTALAQVAELQAERGRLEESVRLHVNATIAAEARLEAARGLPDTMRQLAHCAQDAQELHSSLLRMADKLQCALLAKPSASAPGKDGGA